MSYFVAKRYAKAMFDIAFEQKKAEEVYADLIKLQTLCDQSSEFKQFIQNPIVAYDKQIDILKKMLEKNVTHLTLSFIMFLANKNRLDCLEEVCHVFEKYYMDEQGVFKARVCTRVPLDKAQVKLIQDHFSNKFSKNIEPTVEIDEEMVGGFKIQLEDTVYDCSIRSVLRAFKQQLLKR